MNAQTSFSRVAATLLLSALFSFASWTLLIWAGILLDWTFHDLSYHAWTMVLAIPASALFAYLATKSLGASERYPVHPPSLARCTARSHFVVLAGAIAGAMALALMAGKQEGSFLLPYLLLAFAALFLFAWSEASAGAVNDGKIQSTPRSLPLSLELMAYLATSLILLLFYLHGSSTNADDTHFLGTARGLLKYPDTKLFDQDPIFGMPGMENYVFKLNLGQSFEALAASLAWATGIDLLTVYYLVLPSLACFLVPLPIYLFLSRYAQRLTWFAILLSVALLIVWATHNHNGGYFFLPRLFQGKAWFVSLVVPSLFWIVRTYTLVRSGWWVMAILAALIAGGGFSSTGLYLAPIAAGIALFAFFRFGNLRLFVGDLALLGLLSLPNLLMAYRVDLEMKAMRALPTAGLFDSQGNHNTSIYWAFGDWKQLALIIGIALTTSVGIRFLRQSLPVKSELATFWVILILVTLNDPLSTLLTDLTGIGNLQWRWHWTFPAVIFFGLAGFVTISTIRSGIVGSFRYRPALAVGGLLTALLLTFVAYSWGGMKGRYGLEVRPVKLNAHPLEAAKIIARDYKDRVVLADFRIAEILPLTDWRGRLIGARELYWLMPYFPPHETRFRAKLQALADNPATMTSTDLALLSHAIATLSIDLLVFDEDKVPRSLSEQLTQQGLHCTNRGQWLWCNAGRDASLLGKG